MCCWHCVPVPVCHRDPAQVQVAGSSHGALAENELVMTFITTRTLLLECRLIAAYSATLAFLDPSVELESKRSSVRLI